MLNGAWTKPTKRRVNTADWWAVFFRWNLITVDRTFWGPGLKLTFARWTSTKSSRTIHTYTHTLCKYGCIGYTRLPRWRIAFFFRLHIPTPAACDNDKFKMQTRNSDGKKLTGLHMWTNIFQGGSLFHILFFKHTPGSLKVCYSKWPFIYSWFIYEKCGIFQFAFCMFTRGYVGYLWISWLRWLIFLGWVETKTAKNHFKEFQMSPPGFVDCWMTVGAKRSSAAVPALAGHHVGCVTFVSNVGYIEIQRAYCRYNLIYLYTVYLSYIPIQKWTSRGKGIMKSGKTISLPHHAPSISSDKTNVDSMVWSNLR